VSKSSLKPELTMDNGSQWTMDHNGQWITMDNGSQWTMDHNGQWITMDFLLIRMNNDLNKGASKTLFCYEIVKTFSRDNFALGSLQDLAFIIRSTTQHK
ncbi:hypothetical protein BgiBS90_010858, partial [Biomphalaria glabrata]